MTDSPKPIRHQQVKLIDADKSKQSPRKVQLSRDFGIAQPKDLKQLSAHTAAEIATSAFVRLLGGCCRCRCCFTCFVCFCHCQCFFSSVGQQYLGCHRPVAQLLSVCPKDSPGCPASGSVCRSCPMSWWSFWQLAAHGMHTCQI